MLSYLTRGWRKSFEKKQGFDILLKIFDEGGKHQVIRSKMPISMNRYL